MKWRLSRLDWKYASGELIIVTLGILIAFYIEAWNTDRLERLEEKEILNRLIGDLRADLSNIEGGQRGVDRKILALDRLYLIDSNTIIGDVEKEKFVSDVTTSAGWGWNQVTVRSTTYDELIGSGRFSTIQDVDLREAIPAYYRFFENIDARQSERETSYPGYTFELAPISQNPESLTDEQFQASLQKITEPQLKQLIYAENNFAYFAKWVLQEHKTQNEILTAMLVDYISNTNREN